MSLVTIGAGALDGVVHGLGRHAERAQHETAELKAGFQRLRHHILDAERKQCGRMIGVMSAGKKLQARPVAANGLERRRGSLGVTERNQHQGRMIGAELFQKITIDRVAKND